MNNQEKIQEPTLNVKKLLVPIGSGVVLVIVFVIAINIIAGILRESDSKIADLDSKNQFLQQKVEALRQVDETVKNDATAVYVALPAMNPAAQIVSQMKKSAADTQVILNKIELFAAAANEETNVGRVSIEMDAVGSSSQMLAFLLSLKDVSPMLTVDQTDISSLSSQGTVRATISGYWSPLPKVLPAITDAIEPLSAAELELISLVNELKQPEFGDQIDTEPQLPTSARPNPFSSSDSQQ